MTEKRKRKYRCWDSWDNKMRSTEWLEKHDFALGVDGRMVVRMGNELVLRDHNMLPLEYIGRKDKNGKEIYEGDVARAKQVDDYFPDDSPKEIITKISITIDTEVSEYTMGGPDGSTNFIDVEVIGNIYENPELREFIKSIGH